MVDVEGGKATLVVSPSGESLLIDTGNVGEGAQRDAERIMAAINDAGLHKSITSSPRTGTTIISAAWLC